MTAPRIFCIPAARAPVAAVIARGPSDWVRLGRWDLQRDEYKHGAWLAGMVYPQRCDLSPDGRWFAYFALKPSSTWDAGSTYIAVSRLPWFTALVAGGTDGTWTSGVRFVDDCERWTLPEPAEGSRSAPLSLRLRAASCGDVRHRTGTRVDRDRGHTGARSARHVGREARPARDDAEETSRSRRRRAHRWWSVRRVPRQPQLRPRGLVRARTLGYARDARGSAVGGLGWIRSHARGDDRWTPASPRRGEPGFGRVVGGRSVGGRAGPATAPRRSA